MAISLCNTTTDVNGRELLDHGTPAFPVACYHDDLAVADVPWHWHEEMEAAIVTEGRVEAAVEGRRIELNAGEGFFLNQNVLHGVWRHTDGACRLHSVVFHPRLVGAQEGAIWQKYVRPIVVDRALVLTRLSPEAVELLEVAWRACEAEAGAYEIEVRHALTRMVASVAVGIADAPAGDEGRASQDAERVKLMLSYIQAHLSEPLTVGGIAAAAAISESECIRCFKRVILDTPARYVRKLRIQRAAALIADGKMKVSEAAEACGFNDMSYFSKCFQQQTGCSPSAYRRQQARNQS